MKAVFNIYLTDEDTLEAVVDGSKEDMEKLLRKAYVEIASIREVMDKAVDPKTFDA